MLTDPMLDEQLIPEQTPIAAPEGITGEPLGVRPEAIETPDTDEVVSAPIASPSPVPASTEGQIQPSQPAFRRLGDQFNVNMERLRAFAQRTQFEKMRRGGMELPYAVQGMGTKWSVGTPPPRLSSGEVGDTFRNFNKILANDASARPVSESELMAVAPMLKESEAGRTLLQVRQRELEKAATQLEAKKSDFKTLTDIDNFVQSTNPVVRNAARMKADELLDAKDNTGKTLRHRLETQSLVASRQKEIDALNEADGLEDNSPYAWRINEDGKIWKPDWSNEQQQKAKSAEKNTEQELAALRADRDNIRLYEESAHKAVKGGKELSFDAWLADPRTKGWIQQPDGTWKGKDAPTEAELKRLEEQEKDQRFIDIAIGTKDLSDLTPEQLKPIPVAPEIKKWAQERAEPTPITDAQIVAGAGEDYKFESDDSMISYRGDVNDLATSVVKNYAQAESLEDSVDSMLRKVEGFTKSDYVTWFRRVYDIAAARLNGKQKDAESTIANDIKTSMAPVYEGIAKDEDAFAKAMATEGTAIGYASSAPYMLTSDSNVSDIQAAAMDSIESGIEQADLTPMQFAILTSEFEALRENPFNTKISPQLRNAYLERSNVLQGAVAAMQREKQVKLVEQQQKAETEAKRVAKETKDKEDKELERAERDIGLLDTGNLRTIGRVTPQGASSSKDIKRVELGVMPASEADSDDWDNYEAYLRDTFAGSKSFPKLYSAFEKSKSEWQKQKNEKGKKVLAQKSSVPIPEAPSTTPIYQNMKNAALVGTEEETPTTTAKEKGQRVTVKTKARGTIRVKPEDVAKIKEIEPDAVVVQE